MIPQDRFSHLFYRTCLLGCLLGLAATFYFLAGVNGHLGSPLLNIFTASFLILGAVFFLYIFFVLLPDKSRLGAFIWFLILLVLLTEVVLSLVPPTARDELIHHLALPRLYVNAGRIFEVPFALHSYYPMLLDMLYTPFVHWGWDSTPKLIHGLFGFLTGLMLYSYLARRLSPVYGLMGLLLFVSTPIVLKLGNLAYVDLGLAFYSTASLLCLLRWMEEMENRRWLIFSGLTAGFALATKPNGLLVFLLLFFLLIFILGKRSRGNIIVTGGWIAIFLFLAFVTFSPWFLKNMFQTGNPLFPFFTTLFGSGGDGISGGPSLGIFAKRHLLYGESLWQIAALPVRIFFSGQDNNSQYFDGVLNPVLILFLPWAFKGKWVEEKRLLLGFSLIYFLYALFLTGLRIRYILPIVSPLVILTIYGIHNLYLRVVRPSLLFSAVILLLALNGAYLWGYFNKVSPLGYLLGKENKESYLNRMLPEYPAIQYINRNIPPKAKVYLLFTGNRGYYCERAYFYDTSETGRTLLGILDSAGDEGGIWKKLRRMGITHILARRDLLVRFLNDNLSLDQRKRWVQFGNRYLRSLFEKRGYILYELRRKGSPSFVS